MLINILIYRRTYAKIDICPTNSPTFFLWILGWGWLGGYVERSSMRTGFFDSPFCHR